MVAEPRVFGHVYLHALHEEENLLFVARADDARDDATIQHRRVFTMTPRETPVPGNCRCF
jgi:hypothetical protein